MEDNSVISLAYADDHSGIRHAMSALLEQSGHFKVTIQAGNGQDMLQFLKTANPLPRICIIDIGMPQMNGYALLAEIRKRWPRLRVLIYTMFSREFTVLTMIRRGANGFLTKSSTADELIAALLVIDRQEYYYSEIAGNEIFELIHNKTIKPAAINATELQLLHKAATELSYHEIAVEMGIGYRSLTGIRDRLFAKMRVKSRAGMTLAAVHFGLIPIDF